MSGTNVWGPLFAIAGLILLVLVVKLLISIWSRYSKLLVNSYDMQERGICAADPSWISPTILTILIVGGFVVACTLGWNAVMGVTSNVSSYENPAELEARKKAQQSKAPTKEELDSAKADFKDRADEKPHAAALSSFDKAMKDEAEKIRQRSLNANKKEDVK